MTFHSRPASLAALAVALAGITCAFPTDKSDEVFVTLDSQARVVLRGQDMDVYARAWRVVGTDTQQIANVDFAFATGSSTIARVEKTCCGYATVTGVNSGTVDIVARAVAFEQAAEADLVLRVSNPLEIDSVRPAVVHHGEVLTVYGVGVDSMFLASLGGVNLIEYPFSRQRDSATGLGQIRFWVPPPARPAPLFYLGAGVFGTDTATTDVIFQDVYEPNDTIPSPVNLDLGGPWPGTILAPILFTNPALAFEPVDRTLGEGADWFRFSTSDTTQPLTFFITYPSLGDTTGTRTFLIDSLYYPGAYVGRPGADFVGSEFQRCKGFVFSPVQQPRESTTVALWTLPSRALHVITFFSRPQRYALTVARGYFTADSRIRRDRFEENDFCHFADGQPIPLASGALGFSDTLTIDNPFEIDWYRIDVGAPGVADTVRIRTQSRPFALKDSSDIDVYVLTVPGSTGNLTPVASSQNAGSTEYVAFHPPGAGSYYVAVTDFAGVATRYSMCMRNSGLGTSCALIASAPAPAGVPRRRPAAGTQAAPTRMGGGPTPRSSGRAAAHDRRCGLDHGMPQVPHATAG